MIPFASYRRSDLQLQEVQTKYGPYINTLDVIYPISYEMCQPVCVNTAAYWQIIKSTMIKKWTRRIVMLDTKGLLNSAKNI